MKNYNSEMMHNHNGNSHPIFIGTPTTGLVRMEWAMARFSQIIPTNWGYKSGCVPIPNFAPFNYLVCDAQNIIVKKALQEKSEWLFLVEHDNLLPPDCFVRINDYMRQKDVPIVSGLYFTKSVPAEPMVYRGRGNSYYPHWKIGDKVWVDGVPTGTVLIHRSILETVWNESEEYMAGGERVRKVFRHPQHVWHDPDKGWNQTQGTSDLDFCARVMTENIFEKAGWSKYQKMRYPFLVDTNIFVNHIDQDGIVYPSQEEKKLWQMNLKTRKKNRQKHLALA